MIQKIITCKEEFEQGISDFQLYKSVKVKRCLRDEFHCAIGHHFIAMDIKTWSSTLTPLKKSWKFQRTDKK